MRTSEEAELNRLGLRPKLGDRRLVRDGRLVERSLEQSGYACEILLEHLEHRRRVEGRSRMVERIQRHRPGAERDLLLIPVDPRDAGRLAREKLGREIAERRDDHRLDELDLPEEMRLARRDLLGLRVPVAGRPAFEDVRDEDVRAREADSAEQLVEELPRLPDEGDALLILVKTGRLPDEHEVRIRAARAEDNLCPALRQCTARARRRLLGVLPK